MFEDIEADLVNEATKGVRNAPYTLTLKVASFEEIRTPEGKSKVVLHCVTEKGIKGTMTAGKRLISAMRPFALNTMITIKRSGEGFETKYEVVKAGK